MVARSNRGPLRRHATERHHAAPSSQSRWTTAEASLKGVDRPPAIKERATIDLQPNKSGVPINPAEAIIDRANATRRTRFAHKIEITNDHVQAVPTGPG